MSARFVTSIRLSPDERADVQAQADAAGISLGELIRRRALGHVVQPPRRLQWPVELGQLAGEVARIGNNLNQLAHLAHIARQDGTLTDTVAEGVSHQIKDVRVELAELTRTAQSVCQ